MFDAMLHQPIYRQFGVPATVTDTNGAGHELTAIDRTEGAEVMDHNVGVMTVRPMVSFRGAQLAENGITREDLNRATVAIGGATWIVKATIPRQSLYGLADGTIDCILMEL